MSDDPYTIRKGGTVAPPSTLAGRLRSLGPGIVVSGSIVGSGEILLTAGLGAAAGFVLLWWVLFSCWVKSLVQAELARYVVTSGDTYLRALNRVPGKVGPVAWPLWLTIFGYVPGMVTAAGILGGAGQGLGLLFPEVDGAWATVIAAGLAMLVLGTGTYGRLEKVMLVLVMSFTFATIVSALLTQTTEYRVTGNDILAGLTFDFPLEHAVLALAMYGATGVAASETSGYTYWCIEKGYPTFIGGDRNAPGWVERARGWVRVIQTDVWVTLAVLTCATLAFFFLGAGVLHPLGLRPSGAETINVLSSMYTQVLGPWSFWLFSIGAFCILFSTLLSSIGAGSRAFPDLLVTFGLIDRQNLARRRKWIAGYVIAMPLLSAGIYLTFQRPIWLIIIGASYAAFMLPLQSYLTLFLQARRLDPRVRPRRWVRGAVSLIFMVQSLLSVYIILNMFA